jgi:hypothetical protein
MLNEQQKNYVLRIQQAAKIGQAKTGIPAELIAAWWTWETAFGTNKTHLVNNHAGIKSTSTGKDYVSGDYAGYNTIQNFANDWARIISLNRFKYPEIIQAARAKKSYEQITDAHNDSAWSEDPYNLYTIRKRAEAIRVIYGSNYISAPAPVTPDVNSLSQEDIKKYAAIGLAVLAAIALVKN